jgi:hypothetical protein
MILKCSDKHFFFSVKICMSFVFKYHKNCGQGAADISVRGDPNLRSSFAALPAFHTPCVFLFLLFHYSIS